MRFVSKNETANGRGSVVSRTPSASDRRRRRRRYRSRCRSRSAATSTSATRKTCSAPRAASPRKTRRPSPSPRGEQTEVHPLPDGISSPCMLCLVYTMTM